MEWKEDGFYSILEANMLDYVAISNGCIIKTIELYERYVEFPHCIFYSLIVAKCMKTKHAYNNTTTNQSYSGGQSIFIRPIKVVMIEKKNVHTVSIIYKTKLCIATQ